jgi:DNA-binding transcriptional LysR family regulator
MNLARLRVFEAVSRLGTFAAAADALCFTPSAVSQQISRLEAEAGAVLLERSSRGVRLTPAGEMLLVHAERILREVRAAEAHLESLNAGRTGTLRLGSCPTATQGFVAHVLGDYRVRYKGVHVHLLDGYPHVTARRLADGELDLAVLFKWPGRPIGMDDAQRVVCDDDNFELIELFDDRYVAIVPEGHRLLASAAPPRIEDLKDEIVIGSELTPGYDQLAALLGEAAAPLMFTGHALPDYQSARALVAAGDGVALVPFLATLMDYPGSVTLPIQGPTPYRSVVVARPAGVRLSATGAAMVSLLQEAVGDMELHRSPGAGLHDR